MRESCPVRCGLAVWWAGLPSAKVHIRAGELPPPEATGVSYLKMPLNALQGAGVAAARAARLGIKQRRSGQPAEP